MDIRNPKWFGQLQVSGIGTPFNHQGSIMSIVGECSKDLQQVTPRTLTDGNQEIVIRIRLKPFGADKESNSIMDGVAQLSSMLDGLPTQRDPLSNETYEQYAAHLMDVGLPESSALFIAADWFQVPEPEGLRDWMNDEKAARFRQLNSSQVAFDSALPMEYETLKHYVISTYPQFSVNLVFRTA